jgi:dihydroorotate dehydrogenase
MKNAYERFVRPLLFAIDPETAHRFALGALRAVSNVDLALRALNSLRPPAKPKQCFGLSFPNPIGLAAGLDKNGVALPAWAALGFGFIEIGTVTAKPQPGNPKPRIFRFPEQHSLINRLGFNNDGADAIAARLKQLQQTGRWPRVPIGINIGKSMVTPLTEAIEDYLYSFGALSEFADYVVLSDLLSTITKKNQSGRKPIVVKIAPDLAPEQLEQIISVCENNGVAAIIATNTTLDHSSVPSGRDEQGGLSGAPLRERSTSLVREIAARSTIPVIASGGIMDAESAREKIEAGAQLVQIYTGLIYRGPGLLREIAAAFA